jgi:hypothetical protein
MNVTEPDHILRGVVIRDVVVRDRGIWIDTSSSGKGGLIVNYRWAAEIGWNLSAGAIRNAVVGKPPGN